MCLPGSGLISSLAHCCIHSTGEEIGPGMGEGSCGSQGKPGCKPRYICVCVCVHFTHVQASTTPVYRREGGTEGRKCWEAPGSGAVPHQREVPYASSRRHLLARSWGRVMPALRLAPRLKQ